MGSQIASLISTYTRLQTVDLDWMVVFSRRFDLTGRKLSGSRFSLVHGPLILCLAAICWLESFLIPDQWLSAISVYYKLLVESVFVFWSKPWRAWVQYACIFSTFFVFDLIVAPLKDLNWKLLFGDFWRIDCTLVVRPFWELVFLFSVYDWIVIWLWKMEYLY